MREIPLTRGMVALVDDADFESLSQYRWYAQAAYNSESLFYAARQVRGEDGKQHQVRMHCVIAGAGPGSIVDHRDGDGLNNQRYNLRHATHHINMINRRMHRNNKTGFRGVQLRRGRYVACITAFGTTRHLGQFDSPELAAIAYDMAAEYFFGSEAKANFPLTGERQAS